jgi:hypothetical protein
VKPKDATRRIGEDMERGRYRNEYQPDLSMIDQNAKVDLFSGYLSMPANACDARGWTAAFSRISERE